MGRQAHPHTDDQPMLPLSPAEPAPITEDNTFALRQAFQRTRLARRMTFHQAMAIPALRLCLKNLAFAALNRHQPSR